MKRPVEFFRDPRRTAEKNLGNRPGGMAIRTDSNRGVVPAAIGRDSQTKLESLRMRDTLSRLKALRVFG